MGFETGCRPTTNTQNPNPYRLGFFLSGAPVLARFRAVSSRAAPPRLRQFLYFFSLSPRCFRQGRDSPPDPASGNFNGFFSESHTTSTVAGLIAGGRGKRCRSFSRAGHGNREYQRGRRVWRQEAGRLDLGFGIRDWGRDCRGRTSRPAFATSRRDRPYCSELPVVYRYF